METPTLHRYLSKAIDSKRCAVAGVFPRDLLSFDLFQSFPGCCIANTDDSSLPGKHWVAYYVNSPIDYEFFDSYGLRPSRYGFEWNDPSDMNTLSIQSDYSNTCAHFCLYYLFSKTLGFPMSTIVRSFSPVNLKWNDKLVTKFVSKLSATRAYVHSPNIPEPFTQLSLIKRFVLPYYSQS